MQYKKRAPRESSKELVTYDNEDVPTEDKIKKLKFLS